MVITDFLEQNARLYGSDVALVEVNPSIARDEAKTWRESGLVEISADAPLRRELTWRQFNKNANRFANLLLSRGIKKGTKIGIWMMNSLEWLPTYFGILKAGCIAVPLNYRYAADELKYCVELADCEVLIFGKEFIDRLATVADDLRDIKYFFYVGKAEETPLYAENYIELITYCSFEEAPVINKPEDLAAIYFSSGTTGFPKAILHNHRSLYHAALVEQKHHGQTKDDVFLCIPPLYHTGAKMHWFGSLVTGGKAVLLRGVSPKWILRAVSEEKASIVWLLVPWAQDILDTLDRGELKLEDFLLDSWRLMHIGAQPVPQSLILRWKKYFPKHEYDTNYGLSESLGPGCVHLGVENINKVGAIGVPGFEWEAKIVNPDRNEVAKGEVGELAVRGESVMLEYYKDPKATAEVLDKDGWLYTGDMARQDEDGFYYLVDRKKDVIISGGENLYPVQIEDFIMTNDKVKDVAVIGLPDERLGEIAAAIIEIKESMSATVDEINGFCLGLPKYKRPKKIIFDKVPRNPTGKIEKPALRKKYRANKLVESQTLN